jgi:hypothetical protein
LCEFLSREAAKLGLRDERVLFLELQRRKHCERGVPADAARELSMSLDDVDVDAAAGSRQRWWMRVV